MRIIKGRVICGVTRNQVTLIDLGVKGEIETSRVVIAS